MVSTLQRLLRSQDTSRTMQGVVMVATQMLRSKNPVYGQLNRVYANLVEDVTKGGGVGTVLDVALDVDMSKDEKISSQRNETQQGMTESERARFEALQDEYELSGDRNWVERSVPESRSARVVGFGGLAVGLLAGTVRESLFRDTKASGNSSVLLSQGNSDRIASTLCRMRGAALKLGQILSIQEDTVLPPQLKDALERVRQNADIMPKAQLARVLDKELGENWHEKFKQFDFNPVAAASLGQVHKCTLKDGTSVAMKIQFPGVASSIESDISNLKMLARSTGIFPKGLYIDNIMKVMAQELKEECDYIAEAEHQTAFRSLLAPYQDRFFVPAVIRELTTGQVLTTEWAPGIPIDKTVVLPQAVRNEIGATLLRLSLAELFEFRYMQTDPNYSNYLYDVKTGRISLIDFGASKRYSKEFVDEYLQLVWAASNRDREAVIDSSIKLGFLTGAESEQMIDAHVESGLEVGRPFQVYGPFDFKTSMVSSKVKKHGSTFARERLTPPPNEVYSLHRRLSGAFMICIKIGACFNCRDLLIEAREGYLERNKTEV